MTPKSVFDDPAFVVRYAENYVPLKKFRLQSAAMAVDEVRRKGEVGALVHLLQGTLAALAAARDIGPPTLVAHMVRSSAPGISHDMLEVIVDLLTGKVKGKYKKPTYKERLSGGSFAGTVDSFRKIIDEAETDPECREELLFWLKRARWKPNAPETGRFALDTKGEKTKALKACLCARYGLKPNQLDELAPFRTADRATRAKTKKLRESRK